MQIPERPTKEDYLRWRSDPVTKWLTYTLFNKREYLKEGLVELIHTDDKDRFVDIGQCIALKANIDYIMHDFDHIDKEQIDVEEVGASSTQNYS